MILCSYNVQMNYCCSIFNPNTVPVHYLILPHKVYLLVHTVSSLVKHVSSWYQLQYQYIALGVSDMLMM